MSARRSGRAPARPPLRQVHVWLSPADSEFLTELARARDESVSRLLRRVIGSWRARDQERTSARPAATVAADPVPRVTHGAGRARGGTTVVPEVATPTARAETGAPRRSARGSRTPL